jgi:DDE family transposase
VPYCQARTRLRNDTLEAIQQQLARGLEGNVSSAQLWLGRRVKVVDGTACSMPDTAQNQALYPQPSNQKPGCGFPMLKLVGLFSLASGALLRAVYGPLRVHDLQLLRQLWSSLTKGDLLLADRGFCSFGCLAMLQQAGIDSLMRLHQRRPVNFRRGKRLGKDDRLVAWTKPGRCPCMLQPGAVCGLTRHADGASTAREAHRQRLPDPNAGAGDNPDRCGHLPGRGPRGPLLSTLGVGAALLRTRKPCCASTCYGAVPPK